MINLKVIFVCKKDAYEYTEQKGCDGQVYPDPKTSPYRVPFLDGTDFKMGLSNCSSSYHGAGSPDQYAFDFNFPSGTKFYAIRGGKVVKIVDDQPSNGGGGGAGNYLVVDHGDDTFGLYYHSPKDGILVNKGQTVEQGQLLGFIGASGLAGYPHLHLLVVRGDSKYPYDGIPISFNNVAPADVVLASFKSYRSCAVW